MAAKTSTVRRPLVITVLCVIALPVLALAFYPYVMQLVPLMRDQNGSGLATYSLVTYPVTMVSFIGYWRMARWGVYLYGLLFAAGNGLSLAYDVPITMKSLLVPLIVLGLGFRYFRMMHSGWWTGRVDSAVAVGAGVNDVEPEPPEGDG